MHRTLLVTNDFPPRPGGIQSYLHNIAMRLPASEMVVYTSSWSGAEDFDAAQGYAVERYRSGLMLPTPDVISHAAKMVRNQDISTVWFGAAAPLAVMGPALRRAGATRIVASTHGHEVGWSMIPGARQVLRRIGSTADVVTYVSDYTRRRFGAAFGARAALEYLPPGVDTDRFKPDVLARKRIRERLGIGEAPTVVCLSRLVPRKGQDVLIEALPIIRSRVDGARLVIVGGGPYAARLAELAHRHQMADAVVFTGSVPADELPDYYNCADVFAMPARTRGAGLDVEGFGIVYVEASSCGVPVVAGMSGGAPETVREGETGEIVDGRRVDNVAATVADLLRDTDRAAAMGQAGREWAVDRWRWDVITARLSALL